MAETSPTTTAAAAPAILAGAALVAAAAAWGAALVLTKDLVGVWPPVSLLAVQLAAGVLFLAGCCRAHAPRVARRSRVAWWPVALLGVLEPGLAFLAETWGLVFTTAAKAAVLGVSEPVFVCVLAWWLLGERIGTRMVAAIASTFAGLVLIGVVDLAAAGAPGDPRGDTLVLAAAGLGALSVVLSQRLLVHLEALRFALVQQAAALAFVLTIAAGAAGLDFDVLPVAALTPSLWLQAVLAGVLQFGLAWWLFLAGLRLVGAMTAGVATLLVPVFGVGGAVVFLGERLSAGQAVGCALVVVGVSIVVTARRAKAAAAPAACSRSSFSV